MAFLGKIKSVFGFSDDYETEDNDIEQLDATVKPLVRKPRIEEAGNTAHGSASGIAATKPETSNSDSCDTRSAESVNEDVKCPEAIFTKVVSIFNESLPPFIRENIDSEKQCKYLHESLDASMKEYIAKLDEAAELRIKQIWENDRNALHREMESLKEKAKRIEDSNNEQKEQKLSAERQKRALSERVHDLEKQIDTFQAEKEQYELENKSLVNKLRAMSIEGDDIEKLRNDNDALRNEIKALKEQSSKGIVPAVDQETLKQLDELRQLAEQLKTDKASLATERDNLSSDIAVLKKKCEISDAMINDLNHKASSARQALAERESELAILKSQADSSSESNAEAAANELAQRDAVIKDQLALIEDYKQQLDEAKAEVEESRASLAAFEESLVKIDELNQSRQQRIVELQRAVQDKEKELAAAAGKVNDFDKIVNDKDAQILSLKSTIESNLKLQASSEAKLREEIERLRRPAENNSKRRKKATITSIDESLDDTNWLVSTPPEGTNARTSSINDSEFGYQEPHRRDEPNNPAQMSLW